ncbi:MAG TPA: pyruvate ferredoxin oxidoreductase, partial [bacterium]|nr:pyruvate ferredoxin oxidoreductase [bacterium]
PIVMAVVNRALSAPINIHCDHSDTMGARDAGWIQIFSENVQEAYDNLIQAVRIAEHPEVRLPVMATTDGFILSHCLETMEMLSDEQVRQFIGPVPARENLLSSLENNRPITLGALDLQDYYFEHRRQVAEAMVKAGPVISGVAEEFGQRFGRTYGFVEPYRLDDAEVAVVVMGSTTGTAREVVDKLRSAGQKVGVLKIRVFRPFPVEEIVRTLSPLKAVGIMDRADGLNAFCGPLYPEISAALYDEASRPKLVDFIYGLGGRDVSPANIEEIFSDLLQVARTGKKNFNLKYTGVRE